jgi:hypothetical protein
MKQISPASLAQISGGAERDPVACRRQQDASTVVGALFGGALGFLSTTGFLATSRQRLAGTLIGSAALGLLGRADAKSTHPGCAPA